MNRTKLGVVVLLVINLLAGCHSDIVCTKRVKELTRRCVHIEPLKTEDPYIGKVIGDVVEKEFVRRGFETGDANSATIFISGAAFLTERSVSNKNFLGSTGTSSQAIESVSLVVKNKAGDLLASASYDNDERFTASKIATELGSALAGKLK